uniref:Uncharacterized protein LOC105053464 isoform X1 n=1 Tax=Elaeis guineensis var. tenera TaxID=51953 RepID=A0A6J0PN76_ELAGV|nr:uncharacterized protein LOC105053464 isoform X1 [Elaeis guineensis]
MGIRGKRRRSGDSPSGGADDDHPAPQDWVALNDALLLLIFDRLHSLRDVFVFSAVCRTWRAISLPTFSTLLPFRPPLLLRPVGTPLPSGVPRCRLRRPHRCDLLTPTDPSASYRSIVSRRALSHPFLGYSYGYLIFGGSRPFLANPFTGDEFFPPLLTSDELASFSCAALTAPLSSPDSNLLLCSSHFVLRWRAGDVHWSKHTLELQGTPIRQIITFNGQAFAFLTDDRLFVINFSPYFSMRQLVVPWADGGLQFWIFAPPQLVECDGQLLMVHFSAVKEQMLLSTIRVYRLDGSKMVWTRVDTLGDWALFVDIRGKSTASCSNPSRWGGNANCIYCTGPSCDTWVVLPLDGVVSTMDCQSPLFHNQFYSADIPSPVWMYPSTLF